MSDTRIVWLRFAIGEAPYGIPLDAVAEVAPAATLHLIPLVPLHVGGIVNVRGEPLPVLDGGLLLRHQSADRYRHILVLEKATLRLGVSVGQVAGLGRLRSVRPLEDAQGAQERHVRWVVADGERIGLVDPDAVLARAHELLTGKRFEARGESCPDAL